MLQRPRKYCKPILFVLVVLVGWVIVFAFTLIKGVVPDTYDFLPYVLKVLPGNVGNGGRGWVSPPGIYVTDRSHPIAYVPVEMKRMDLGAAGDFVIGYDEKEWKVVACAEGTMFPAIMSCTFKHGKIVYVTNQLYEHHKLLCNIFTFFSREKSELRVALMTDVPKVPEVPSLDKWQESFSRVNMISKGYGGPMVEMREIHAYNLHEEIKQEFDVLILMTGWGDGYYSGSSGWHNSQRSKSILEFVGEGGCLLLPEAGFRNRITPSFHVLLELFSSPTTCLTMVAPSITFAASIVALKDEIRQLSGNSVWIMLVCCFIAAANLWIIAAALVYSFVVDAAIFVISTAFLLDVLPSILVSFVVVYRLLHRNRSSR